MKKAYRYGFFLFLISMAIGPLYSQVKQSHSVVTGFLQFRDEFGLGMVFTGVHLEYRYGLQWKINDHEILYQPELGAGVAFKRGMTGGNIHIAPVNLTWTMPFLKRDGHTIRSGVNFSAAYNYQYTELNDGPLFWNAVMGFSPVIRYGYQWGNKCIIANLQNSLFGFSSRRQGYDPYEWSFSWKDFVVSPHKNMRFGSFNDYIHAKFSVEFIPNVLKMHSFAYEFDYLGFFYGYRFDRINHNLLWRMSL